MQDFYDIIDTYAGLNKMDRNDALHEWYRGNITPTDLLNAALEDEGIIGYTDWLVNIIKMLRTRSHKDGFGEPWKL